MTIQTKYQTILDEFSIPLRDESFVNVYENLFSTAHPGPIWYGYPRPTRELAEERRAITVRLLYRIRIIRKCHI